MDTALFDELLESVQQMDAIVKGKARPSRVHEVDAERVKQIRKRTKLSQPAFARVIDVSVATLRNWEQGRRGIEGAARSLFTVLESNPEVVLAALMRKRKPAATRTARKGRKPVASKTIRKPAGRSVSR